MVAAAFAGLVTVSSCSKTCDPGYEGTDCKTETRAKYIGAFTGTETCDGGTSTITITYAAPSQGTDVTAVTIQNLYGANFVSTGTVQADGSINIPSQTFGTGTISGSITVTGGKIKATYVVAGGGNSDNCSWVQN